MLRAVIFVIVGVFISSSAMAACGGKHGDKTATSTTQSSGTSTAETTAGQTTKPKS